MQISFFEVEDSYKRLDKAGDPLLDLHHMIDWEDLRPVLLSVDLKPGAKGGRPGLDPLMMVKCLLLQSRDHCIIRFYFCVCLILRIRKVLITPGGFF